MGWDGMGALGAGMGIGHGSVGARTPVAYPLKGSGVPAVCWLDYEQDGAPCNNNYTIHLFRLFHLVGLTNWSKTGPSSSLATPLTHSSKTAPAKSGLPPDRPFPPPSCHTRCQTEGSVRLTTPDCSTPHIDAPESATPSRWPPAASPPSAAWSMSPPRHTKQESQTCYHQFARIGKRQRCPPSPKSVRQNGGLA